MPTYQYVCTECDAPLEAVQSFTDDALTVCPVCSGRLRKVFTAVGVVFKGSGFYRNDSRAKESANGSGDGKKSDDKSAGDKKSEDAKAGGKESAGTTSSGKGSASSEKSVSSSPSKDSKSSAPVPSKSGSGSSSGSSAA